MPTRFDSRIPGAESHGGADTIADQMMAPLSMSFRRWFLLALAILSAAVAAAVALNRPADPPPPAGQVMQAGAGLSWYRGNLHTHTLWSDGNDHPESVIDWYRNHGYHFLALSEHNLLPGGDRWVDPTRAPDGGRAADKLQHMFTESTGRRQTNGRTEIRLRRHDELATAFTRPGEFLLLQAEEISDSVGSVSVHINAVNLQAAIEPARRDDVNLTIEDDFASAAALSQRGGRDILMQLNHPNFVYSITAEQLMRLRGSPFFEVYNGHPLSSNPGDGLRPPTDRLWDIALAWRLEMLGLPLLYGTATDDSHQYQEAADASPGRGWVVVLTDTLEPDSLIGAMRKGRFYASTGVQLQRVVATPDRLEVEVVKEPGVDYLIEFIGTRTGFDADTRPAVSATGRPLYASRGYSDDIGRVFARHKRSRAVYRFGNDDLYVRARITSSRRHPNPSQPMQFEQAWVQPLVGPAGRQSVRKAIAAPTSVAAELHRGVTRRFQPMTDSEKAVLLPSSPTGTGRCALEVLADGAGRRKTMLARSGQALFGGWLVDLAADDAPDSLAVVLKGDVNYVAEGGPDRARPDVAHAFAKPLYERAGFFLDFELANVVPDDYRVWLIGFDKGKAIACDSGLSLRVM